MSQIDTIYSAFDQLTTWEQYRDLLIETLTASGYPNLDNIIRSGFTENHFDNPELLAQFIVPLFSPHPDVANALYSGTDPLGLLTRIDRTKELLVNGNFNVDLSGWVINASDSGAEPTWVSGAARLNGGGPGLTSRLRQELANLPVGRYYFTSTGNYTSLAFGFTAGSSEVSGYSNLKQRVLVHPQTGSLWLAATSAAVETLDNLSIRRID